MYKLILKILITFTVEFLIQPDSPTYKAAFYCAFINKILCCPYTETEEVITMISYDSLWKTMKRNKVSQYRLLKSGIDNKTLDRLKKNQNITAMTIEKLCAIVGCTPNDILSFTE